MSSSEGVQNPRAGTGPGCTPSRAPGMTAGCLEQEEQEDQGGGHRAVVHAGTSPRPVPGGLPDDANSEWRL